MNEMFVTSGVNVGSRWGLKLGADSYILRGSVSGAFCRQITGFFSFSEDLGWDVPWLLRELQQSGGGSFIGPSTLAAMEPAREVMNEGRGLMGKGR